MLFKVKRKILYLMCGRTITVSKIEKVEKVYNVKLKPSDSEFFKPNYNCSVGQLAPVITSQNPNQLQMFKFGLTPEWASKEIFLFNARSEGDNNKENDSGYTGGMGIISKPAFRKQIRSKRCLIIVDAFYEGSEKEGLSKPYLVYLIDRKPFALAGLYDTWVNPDTQQVVNSFTIVTTVANDLMKQIGHHRSPVILSKMNEYAWLNEKSSLASVTKLMQPYDKSLMNAYPVSPLIKNPKNNNRELIEPIGERIYKEFINKVVEYPKVEGMGKNKDRGWGEKSMFNKKS